MELGGLNSKSLERTGSHKYSGFSLADCDRLFWLGLALTGWALASLGSDQLSLAGRSRRTRPPLPTAEAETASRAGRGGGSLASGARESARQVQEPVLHPGLGPGSTVLSDPCVSGPGEGLRALQGRRDPGGRSWESGAGGRPHTDRGCASHPGQDRPSRRRGAPWPGFCDPR